MLLVTLQQARDHLRSDTTADNADLTLKIHIASDAVVNYLKSAAYDFLDSALEPFLDSNDEPMDIPYAVQGAVLMLIDILYNQRDGGEAFNPNYLPQSVVSLLYPLRDPALA
jgi:hypothetical protein